MKLRILSPLILALLFCSTEICQAQFMNRIKRTAERAASRVVERKVEKEVEKAMERQVEKTWVSIFGEQTDAQGRPVDWSKVINSMNMDVTTEDMYEFDGRAVVEITGKDNKGKNMDPMVMHSYLSKSNEYTAVRMESQEAEQMFMIFDVKNDATIILMEKDGERQSMAYSINWEELAAAMPEDAENPEDVEDFENLDFKKTGNTKTLLGHLCEEYEVENEEYRSTYWVTKEPIEGAAAFWGNSSPYFNQKFKGQSSEAFSNLPSGNILEMNYISKTDKTDMIFQIKEIDDNHSMAIHMAEYPNIMLAER
ncbi:hypothetical protein KI659_15860 [Litoribacter alkaliphilus]|uniref:DUF4412 domain-containing protein n=1 Tax=Litoribacter ruber TaxID=702568 RepID=A0AAP2CPG2_9BACT|nr:DUF4412 domain-containing protein [Litoribacter alkaliphilus]MBS9525492.1 hypothetical protein [Litoribacter alkaliphilus]